MNDIHPSPRFTGLFIPAEIWEIEGLTLFDITLLSWVDALYCKNHGGCFASNEYLSKRMKNAKINTVAKAISKLRGMGLIEDVSFNGRQRVIKANIGKSVHESQSKSALDLNPTPHWIKIQPSVGLKSNATDSSPIYYNKEDNKEEREDPPPLFVFGKHIKMKRSEYDQFVAKHGKAVIEDYLQTMDDYISSVKGKPYLDAASALRNWIKRDKNSGKENVAAETNKKFAKKIVENYSPVRAKRLSVALEALHNRLVISSTHPTYSMPSTEIDYSEKGFQEQVENALRKWGLK